MATITVFTPTYNRAYCLHRCYNSLLRQTSQDFEWLIIDDGSTDNTRELIQKWKDEAKIVIHYIYKNNGGMHSGYNVAYNCIYTELAMCIDSDDYLLDNSIQRILETWKSKKRENVAGIMGLDITSDGEIIGTKLPEVEYIKVYDFYYRYKGRGDKKQIYRPELMREFLSPEFKGEKLFPTCYKYYQVDLNYDMIVLNEPLCVVEYMQDGFTSNIMQSYKKNLNSYIFYRRFILSYPYATKKHKFQFAIHYVAECMLNREKHWLSKVESKPLVVLAIPFGLILYLYINIKT